MTNISASAIPPMMYFLVVPEILELESFLTGIIIYMYFRSNLFYQT